MAKIALSSGFTLIPEGEQVFKIVGCQYKEKFGKIEVALETKKKQKHTERFDLTKDGGRNAFYYLAKTALNDYDVEEIDPDEIVGLYFRAEVTHTTMPHRDDESKTVTFVNLGNKSPADGFDDDDGDDEPPAPAPKGKAKATPKTETAKPKYDLSFLDDM